MKIKQINKDEFNLTVADINNQPMRFLGSKPAVIDFYATWCGPCMALAPIMEQLSQTYGNKVDFYKVDIDAERQLSAAFKVRSVPTLVFFSSDGTQKRMIGFNSKADIEHAVNDMIKDNY